MLVEDPPITTHDITDRALDLLNRFDRPRPVTRNEFERLYFDTKTKELCAWCYINNLPSDGIVTDIEKRQFIKDISLAASWGLIEFGLITDPHLSIDRFTELVATKIAVPRITMRSQREIGVESRFTIEAKIEEFGRSREIYGRRIISRYIARTSPDHTWYLFDARASILFPLER